MITSRAMHVVAIVPARQRADLVGDAVGALRQLAPVERVIVVDDGSTDATTARARLAGAEVLKLPRNRGKGGAVTAAVSAAPDADIYLLVDADVGATAVAADRLLAPVLAGQADMTIGVLPAAGPRGGFGGVKRLAAAGIQRASSFRAAAPLSGQRAVRGELLRRMALAPRFGLETALTIDAVRAGARVVEVAVDMDHRHTGRRLSGFRHRGGQGVDVARALWPRLTSPSSRLAIIGLTSVLVLGWALWSGGRWEPPSRALNTRPAKVVIFGVPHLGLGDLGRGFTPHLDGLARRGAVAAMSVATASKQPSSPEAYASLGAGAAVKASADAGLAYPADAPVEAGTSRQAITRRTGRPATGPVVVLDYPSSVRLSAGRHLGSMPGALGDALHAAGLRTAVVGSGDASSKPNPQLPASLALVDGAGTLDAGTVERSLLEPDPQAPFGVRFDEARVASAVSKALDQAEVVAIDPGDLDRAAAAAPLSIPAVAEDTRLKALARTDSLLGRLVSQLPPDVLVLVASVTPPGAGFELTPLIVVGPGVPSGYAHSPSVRRQGVVTLTDLAPTVLQALDARTPKGMIGRPLRYGGSLPDVGHLQRLGRDAALRDSIYFPVILAYIVVVTLLYLFAIATCSRHRGQGQMGAILRWAVVAAGAFPLATFLVRAIPGTAELGRTSILVLVAIDVAIATVAVRARWNPLAPLSVVAWATSGLLVVDLATGGRLQVSSILGYSLSLGARFTGIGNVAFAVLAACALIPACAHVHYSRRRREALVVATAALITVAIVDGAPSLGNDVGGILTLVPVYGLTLAALWGRRLSWRTVAVVGAALVASVGLAVALDLLRAPDQRTHLGRFAAELASGGSPARQLISRKLESNLRVLQMTPWAWPVPLVALSALYLIAFEKRGQALLPRGSALRACVVSLLVTGLLGGALNDSGVIITAVTFVYLGALLTLLALEHDQGKAVLLPPLSAGTQPDALVPLTTEPAPQPSVASP